MGAYLSYGSNAVEVLPVTTFLAYRFTTAAVVVALVSRRQLWGLAPVGRRMRLGGGSVAAVGDGP